MGMNDIDPRDTNRRIRRARTAAQRAYHRNSRGLRYATGRGIDDGFRLDTMELCDIMNARGAPEDQYHSRERYVLPMLATLDCLDI